MQTKPMTRRFGMAQVCSPNVDVYFHINLLRTATNGSSRGCCIIMNDDGSGSGGTLVWGS